MIFMIMAVSEIWKLGDQEAAKAFPISGAEAEEGAMHKHCLCAAYRGRSQHATGTLLSSQLYWWNVAISCRCEISNCSELFSPLPSTAASSKLSVSTADRVTGKRRMVSTLNSCSWKRHHRLQQLKKAPTGHNLEEAGAKVSGSQPIV